MTPFASVLPRPSARAAALVAAVAAVAIAVALLIPAPHKHATPRQAPTYCGPTQRGASMHGHCRPAIYVMEIETRFVDPHFAQPPPQRMGCRYPVDPHIAAPHSHRVPHVHAHRWR
ncbi:MAG: hypothetical protein IPL61_27770 [Myxococcales bacterium]|nr:hypothetical protein [Myxococcales bacterium]